MRTLSVIAEMGSGGAETVVAELARRSGAAGHATAVASSGGWRADELRAHGVRLVDVPLRDGGAPALARSAARLWRELRAHPVDLVHTHNVRATFAAAVARRARPVLTTVHGLADDAYPQAARLLRRCSDTVVAVSADVATRLVTGGLAENRIVVIENAVPPPPGSPADRAAERAAVRRDLAIAPDAPVVLCVARLAPPKRVDLLLDAWGAVVRELPDAVLLVAGDGPGRPELEARAAGLPGVRLLGDRRDVGRLLAAADLLVLPSDREGLPMSVLEAMAAGVPVIATGVGGLTGLDPSAITLVPPGEARALASAIGSTLRDEARRRALAEAGRLLVERRFSADRMAADYLDLYEEVGRRWLRQ